MTWLSRSQTVWPSRSWWYVLLVIMLLAAGLRYPGYDFSFPYIDHADEPAYNLAARMIIDFGSAKPLGMHGYPPGIVTVNLILLRAFHDPSLPPSSILWIVRLLSITVSVLTVLVMGLLGYRVATPLAGLVAAWLWAVSPRVVEHSRFATADPYVTFFAVLALFWTISGTLYDRDRWTNWGIFACIMAVIFKYQAIVIVPLVLFLPLWRLRSQLQRRRILVNFGYNFLTLALFGFWLVAIYPVTEAHESPYWSAAPDKLGVPTMDILKGNLTESVLRGVNSKLVWQAGLAALILLFIPTIRRHANGIGLFALGLGAVMWFGVVSLYGWQFFRQFISASAFLTVLAGTGLALGVTAMALLVERIPRVGSFSRAQAFVTVLGITAIVFLTRHQLAVSIDDAKNCMLHDRRNDLAAYADSSLAGGPYISNSENHKTFNRDWGGYRGKTNFPLFQIASITEHPVEYWREQGVKYAIVPYDVYETLANTPQGSKYLEETVLLKAYPPSSRYRGPAMVMLALDPIQYQTNQQLGPIHLIGYDIDHITVRPGESVTFRLYWQSDTALDVDYLVYNHLTPLFSRDIVAQVDGPPLGIGKRGTASWDDPTETLISQPFTLTIGTDVQPGRYRLMSGFYRRDTWERLHTAEGADFLLITEITVVAD